MSGKEEGGNEFAAEHISVTVKEASSTQQLMECVISADVILNSLKNSISLYFELILTLIFFASAYEFSKLLYTFLSWPTLPTYSLPFYGSRPHVNTAH